MRRRHELLGESPTTPDGGSDEESTRTAVLGKRWVRGWEAVVGGHHNGKKRHVMMTLQLWLEIPSTAPDVACHTIQQAVAGSCGIFEQGTLEQWGLKKQQKSRICFWRLLTEL